MNRQDLIKKVEKLESIILNTEKSPECIIFIAVDGRVDGIPDTTPIVRYTSNNIDYDIEPGETEETFLKRIVGLAKANLQHPLAIPTLFAYTEQMLSEKVV